MSLTDIFGAQFPYIFTSSLAVSLLLMMLPRFAGADSVLRVASLGFTLVAISALILTLTQDSDNIPLRGLALTLLIFGMSCFFVELGNFSGSRKLSLITAAVVVTFGVIIFIVWLQSPPYSLRLTVIDAVFAGIMGFFGFSSIKMDPSHYPTSRFVLSTSALSFVLISLLRLFFFHFLSEHYFALEYFAYFYVSVGIFSIFGLGFGFALLYVELLKSNIALKNAENKLLLADVTEKKAQLEDIKNFLTHEIVRPINSAKALCRSMRQMGKQPSFKAAPFYTEIAELQKLEKELDSVMAQIHAVREFDDVASLLSDISVSDLDIEHYFYTIQSRWNVKLELNENTFDRGLKADGFLLDIAIDNIIENAFKYGKGGVRLVVSCDESSICHIDVIDEGAGIPISYWQNVWGLYFRVNNESSTTITGSGIGMFLTSKILSAHHGSTRVVSNLPSTIRLSLPCR